MERIIITASRNSRSYLVFNKKDKLFFAVLKYGVNIDGSFIKEFETVHPKGAFLASWFAIYKELVKHHKRSIKGKYATVKGSGFRGNGTRMVEIVCLNLDVANPSALSLDKVIDLESFLNKHFATIFADAK